MIMAELIDIYTQDGEHIGVADRDVAHRFGLWHRTIHCWIIKDGSKIIFQKRGRNLAVEPGKLTSTASGHLVAGETPAQGFAREVFEEVGIKIENPVEIFSQIYQSNTAKNGKPHIDNVVWNLFVAKCDLPLSAYQPQVEELDGFVEIDIAEFFKLADGRMKSMLALALLRGADGKFEMAEITVRADDFLCLGGETLNEKWSPWLRQVCQKLSI